MSYPITLASSLFSELSRIQEEFENSFAPVFTGNSIWNSGKVFPPIAIAETDEDIRVYALAAGLDTNSLDVTIQGNLLTLSGNRKDLSTSKENYADRQRCYHRRERPLGTFTRVVTLPDHVDPRQVHATYDSGVLSVLIGKRLESKPRKIDVKID